MKTQVWQALVAAGLLLATFAGGRRYQAHRDVVAADTAAMRARAKADSARRVSDSTVAAITARRSAETVARGLAQAEADRLRALGSNHAKTDRDKDQQLKDAKTDAERVPILTSQRDEARAAYEDAVKTDSQNVKVIASLRADSARADSVLQRTKEGHAAALGAMQNELRAMAVKVEAATLKHHFLGFLPPLECVAGYGAQVAPSQPIQVSHGAQVTCGFRILELHL